MTKRERILAGLVAATVLLVGGVYLTGRITGKFDERHDALADLDQAIAAQQRVILQGKAAEKRIADWRAKALPEDVDVARTLYLNWLRDRAVAVQLEGLNITPLAGRQESKFYYRLPFQVSGRGDLRQLTQLLYDFYSVDSLHRISRLNVTPIANSRQLAISITIEALSMTGGSDGRHLRQPSAENLAGKAVSEYVNPIVARNLFSPANKPPTLSSLGPQQGNPDRPLSFRAQATDPEQDALTYEIEGDAPDGLSLDSRTGEFRWTPKELGNYEVSFRVSDGRHESEPRTVRIAVVEPPPPPTPRPGFDVATLAWVSGITASGEEPVVWIRVPTEDKTLRLRKGDQLSVGSVQGEIVRIDLASKTAEIATPDGRKIYLAHGKNLAGENSADLGGI